MKKITPGEYRANVRGFDYRIFRDYNKPLNDPAAWVVSRDGEWIGQAPTFISARKYFEAITHPCVGRTDLTQF